MYFAKITYHKSFGIPCHIQYCEVGDDLYVSRCVEKYWNGEFGYASTDNVHGVNGTILPEKTFFAESELESNSLEGEFVFEVITQSEFEQIWSYAVKSHQSVKRKQIYNTNKQLLKVTLLEAFRDLRISVYPETASQTLEQFSSLHGYYLDDHIIKVGIQQPIQEQALRKIAPKIFRQELSELSIPPEKWPDTESFEVFQKFIKVEYLALIADFGEQPLKNNVTEL